jgi:hypothetical protein
MPSTHTKYILVQCPDKLVKVAYISFLEGGDISFGSTDESECAKREKITYHPDHRVHVKGPSGEYASEALTWFNNPMVDKEWMWCEAISNPLSAIKSGSMRANRSKDIQLTVSAPNDQSSVRIRLYKLPQAATDNLNDAHLCEHVEWYDTFLRIEVCLVPPQTASLEAFVMN